MDIYVLDSLPRYVLNRVVAVLHYFDEELAHLTRIEITYSKFILYQELVCTFHIPYNQCLEDSEYVIYLNFL